MAAKSPLLCVKRCPIQYGFRGGAPYTIRYSVKIAQVIHNFVFLFKSMAFSFTAHASLSARLENRETVDKGRWQNRIQKSFRLQSKGNLHF